MIYIRKNISVLFSPTHVNYIKHMSPTQDIKSSSRADHKQAESKHQQPQLQNYTGASSDPSENNKYRLLGDLPSLAGDRSVKSVYIRCVCVCLCMCRDRVDYSGSRIG